MGSRKSPDEQAEDPRNKTENEFVMGKRRTSTWKNPKTGLEWQCESPGSSCSTAAMCSVTPRAAHTLFVAFEDNGTAGRTRDNWQR